MAISVSGILQEHKRKKGVTNQWIADTARVSKGTVDRIMAGASKSPRHDTLQAIASAVDCGMAEFDGVYVRTDDVEDEVCTSENPAEDARYCAMICTMEDRLAEQRDRYDAEIGRMRKWLSIVVAICIALMGILIAILMIDLLNPHIGWFRAVRFGKFAQQIDAILIGHA